MAMKAQVAELAAVAAMAIGLTFGTAGATTAATSIPCAERPEADGGTGSDFMRLIRVSPDRDETPRAGYMVGRIYFGLLPE
jgi:hypothetical protein